MFQFNSGRTQHLAPLHVLHTLNYLLYFTLASQLVMDDYRLRLQRLRQYTRRDGSIQTLPFVPEADLYSRLTRNTLEDALANPAFHLEPNQRVPTAGEVMNGARKIFAILIQLRFEEKLKTCLEKSLMDSNLPIQDEKGSKKYFPSPRHSFRSYNGSKFRSSSESTPIGNLDSGCILPFVKNTKISSGEFSTVF